MISHTKITANTWKLAFLFSFLALLVDGADVMMLSYSLTSIKKNFGLTECSSR